MVFGLSGPSPNAVLKEISAARQPGSEQGTKISSSEFAKIANDYQNVFLGSIGQAYVRFEAGSSEKSLMKALQNGSSYNQYAQLVAQQHPDAVTT